MYSIFNKVKVSRNDFLKMVPQISKVTVYKTNGTGRDSYIVYINNNKEIPVEAFSEIIRLIKALHGKMDYVIILLNPDTKIMII